ncbi:MAG: TadE/TadG family type IV pilus assembly protein [Parcubacteria group bacterium]
MNRRAFHRDERGAAATEFALILPMMLIIAFGIFEAGRVFWSYNIVQSAARDAARYGARLGITCSGSTATFDDSGSMTQVQNLARTGTVDGTGDPLIPGWTDNATVTVALACVSKTSGTVTFGGRYDGQTAIPTVTVTAAAPYGVMFGGLFGDLTIDAVSVNNAEPWTA